MSLEGKVAGSVQLGQLLITALLDEGTITPVVTRGMTGLSRDGASYQTPISIGDWVEFFDDAAIDADACGNIPVVRKLQTTGSRYIARVREIIPAPDVPIEETSDLAARIAGNYMAKATLEVPGLIGLELIEATVPAKSPTADKIEVGAPTQLTFDVSAGVWLFGTGTGNEFIPLHHVAGSTSVDVTGRIVCALGMKKMEVV